MSDRTRLIPINYKKNIFDDLFSPGVWIFVKLIETIERVVGVQVIHFLIFPRSCNTLNRLVLVRSVPKLKIVIGSISHL